MVNPQRTVSIVRLTFDGQLKASSNVVLGSVSKIGANAFRKYRHTPDSSGWMI